MCALQCHAPGGATTSPPSRGGCFDSLLIQHAQVQLHVAPHVVAAVLERAVRVLVAATRRASWFLVEGHALVEVLIVGELVAPADRVVLVLAARGLTGPVLDVAPVLRVGAVGAHSTFRVGGEAVVQLTLQTGLAGRHVWVVFVAVGHEADLVSFGA